MWTLCTRLKTLVSAMGARDEHALRANQDVNDQSDNAGDHDEDHPEHGIVHAAIFRIFRDPDKDGNVNRDESEDDKAEKAEASACGGTAGSIVVPLKKNV